MDDTSAAPDTFGDISYAVDGPIATLTLWENSTPRWRCEHRHDGEERIAESQTAVLQHRGRKHVVRLVNLSSSGAMVIFPLMPHIGEQIMLQLLGRDPIEGHVKWLDDLEKAVEFVKKGSELYTPKS